MEILSEKQKHKQRANAEIPSVIFACQKCCDYCGNECDDYCEQMELARKHTPRWWKSLYIRCDFNWREVLKKVRFTPRRK